MSQIIAAPGAGTFTSVVGVVPELLTINQLTNVSRVTVVSSGSGVLFDGDPNVMNGVAENVMRLSAGFAIFRLADGELQNQQCTVTIVATGAAQVYGTSTRKGETAVLTYVETVQTNSYQKFSKFRKLALDAQAGTTFQVVYRSGDAYTYGTDELAISTLLTANWTVANNMAIVDNSQLSLSSLQVNTAGTAQTVVVQTLKV